MIKTFAFAPVLVAAALLLSACHPTGGDGGGSSSPPPTDAGATPTPTVTESAAPATKPAVGDLILSPEGLGPLVIGVAPPATNPALDIAILDPDYCAAYVADYGVAAAKWIPNYEPALSSDDGGDPFALLVEGGVLNSLEVRSPLLHTAAGIHIGSSLANLTAAYPGGFTSILHNGIADIYSVDGTHGRILFEVPADSGDGYWEASDLGKVLFIRVIPLTTALYGVSGTDGGYSGCVSA